MAIQQVHGQSQGVMGGGIKCDCTIACTASNHFVLLLRFASSATPDIFLAATILASTIPPSIVSSCSFNKGNRNES
eukprot:m.122887 g.122887  ORF g.122887 m.122887 type:complete len:76 (+) comp13439_c0_seq3:851-1078(+)